VGIGIYELNIDESLSNLCFASEHRIFFVLIVGTVEVPGRGLIKVSCFSSGRAYL
jgi:hypothetical protein